MIYQRQIKPSSNRNSFPAFTLIEPPVVRRCKRRAFTLIELLVVVAIIALLLAILVPSLNEARALALQVRCLVNLKQFGTAVLYYLADNDDNLFVTGTGGVTKGWYVTFSDYMGGVDHDADAAEGKSDMWVCPADEKRFAATGWAAYPYGSAPWGYCTNSPNIIAAQPDWKWLYGPVWSHDIWKLWQIPSPADTMIFTEAIQGNLSGVWSAYCADSYPGNINYDWDGDGIIDSHSGILSDARYGHPYCNVAPRHPNLTANLTFLDGHAAGWNIVDIMKPPDENNDLWGRKLFD